MLAMAKVPYEDKRFSFSFGVPGDFSTIKRPERVGPDPPHGGPSRMACQSAPRLWAWHHTSHPRTCS